MDAEAKLNKFVRRIILGQRTNGYTNLRLVQAMAGGSDSLLRVFELNPESVYTSTDADNITADLYSTAVEDADGHRGLTTYAVVACKGASRGERSSVFRLRSQETQDSEEGLITDTEAANPQGLLAQLMRHLEAKERQSVIKDEIYVNGMTAQMRIMAERLQHYENKHWENIQQKEELASQKEERELNRLTIAQREKRLDQTFDVIKPLAAIAVSKLKGLPSGAKEGMQMHALTGLLKKLTPAQLEKIIDVIGIDSPEVLALGQLYLDANKEDVEREEQASKGAAH